MSEDTTLQEALGAIPIAPRVQPQDSTRAAPPAYQPSILGPAAVFQGPPSTAAPHDVGPKMALPAKFTGKRHALRTFLNQLELLFTMHSNIYAADRVKIATLGSLLEGTAADWFNHYIEHAEEHQALLNNWTEFKELMRATFGEHDRALIAANRITSLCQDHISMNQYVTQFRHYASDLSWDDASLIHNFRQGLCKEIRDRLLNYDMPTTLNEMINLAYKIDSRLYEHRQAEAMAQRSRQRLPAPTSNVNGARSFNRPPAPIQPRNSFQPRGQPRPFRPFPPRPPLSSEWTHQSAQPLSAFERRPPPVAVNMDLDAVARGPMSLPQRPQHTNDHERQRRRDNNLCFYCGSSDHVKLNCPQLASRRGNGRGQ